MSEIFYNNGNDTHDRTLTNEIRRLIREAKVWIKACNLFFDDAYIREDLLETASRGVAIFILTNLQGVTAERRKDKVTGRIKQDAQTTKSLFHSAALNTLYEAGAHISGLDGLHAKFLLTDDKRAMVTSLNFDPNSVFKITELGVSISGPEYDDLEKIFDQLFLRPDQFRFANHDAHFSYERPSNPIDDSQFSKLSRVKMTLGPTSRGRGDALEECDCHELRDEIFSIINSATDGESLYIATYSLDPNTKGSDDETLASALKRAKDRGVHLHIVMRKEKKLVIKGVFIHYHSDNHAKAVLSNQRGIIFTGNLTTESFESGFDLGVVLNPEQITETREFIIKLIDQARK